MDPCLDVHRSLDVLSSGVTAARDEEDGSNLLLRILFVFSMGYNGGHQSRIGRDC